MEDLTMNEIKNNFIGDLRNSEYDSFQETGKKQSQEDLELSHNL